MLVFCFFFHKEELRGLIRAQATTFSQALEHVRSTLQQTIDGQNQNIVSLQQTVDGQKQTIVSLQQTVDDQNQTIDTLQQTVDDQRQAIEEKCETIVQQQQTELQQVNNTLFMFIAAQEISNSEQHDIAGNLTELRARFPRKCLFTIRFFCVTHNMRI